MTTDIKQSSKQRVEKEDRTLLMNLSHFVIDEHYNLMPLAWDDFFCFQSNSRDDYEDEDLFFGAFLHFFCYNWTPNPDIDTLTSSLTFPLALEYLSQYRDELSDHDIHYIHQSINTRYSIYEVLSTEPNRGVKLRDLLGEEEFWLESKAASESLDEEQIMMASILRTEDLNLCVGLYPHIVPSSCRDQVLRFRKELQHSATELTRPKQEYLMREFFYSMVNQGNQEEKVTVINLTFDLDCSMEQALELLVTLSDGLFNKEYVAEMPQNKLLDPSSMIVVPWLDRDGRTDDSFKLRAFLNLRPGTLEVSFDSIHGIEQTKARIQELFGPIATYVSTVIGREAE